MRRPNTRAAASLAVVGWTVVLASVASAQTSTGANGQTLGVSVSLASLWDDETHLGRGPAVAAEVTTPLGGYLRLGAEAGWLPHRRDAGYLAAEGHALHLMARATLFAGPPRWHTRPFLGGGLGLTRSSGTLTTRDPFGPSGDRRSSWALARAAWDLQLGVRSAVSERWVIRPEVRVGAIGGVGYADGLQTPLLRLQGGIAVEWARR